MSECKCFDVMLEKVAENLREQLPANERESFEAQWDNQAFVIEGDAMTKKVGLPVSYEYQKRKKSGEPHKSRTKGDVKMMMNYCPFCGESLKKKAEAA